MKNKINILKIGLTLLLSVFLLLPALASSSYIKNRWSIKAGYSKSFPATIQQISSYWPLVKTEVNYGINNFIEIGGGLGYSPSIVINDKKSSQTYSQRSNIFIYGLNVNFHLLPLVVKSKDFRIDLYSSGKIGGYFTNLKSKSNYTGVDYGIYAGAAFYFSKHLGIFGEYGFGNKTNLRYGLSFKF